jgi:glycosyltransferase involved in cell wall biosynthesis
MACGCPVISSTRGSLGEVIGDAAAVIDPENISSMAEQLAAVAENSDLRLRLQNAGLKQARQFDWKRTAEETFRIYERAVSRLKSARARSRRMPEPTPDERESARIAAAR